MRLSGLSVPFAALLLALFPAAVAAHVSSPSDSSKPPAWVIRDADTEITLFATIHALPAGTDWLAPSVAARLDAADMIVLEALVPEDLRAFGAVIQRLGVNPALPPLAQRIAPQAAARLPAAAAAAGVSTKALDTMQPWLAAVTLSEATLASIGISAENGVEPMLTARARAAAKPLVQLETPEQQIGFFASLSQPDQRAMLETTLADIGDAREDVGRLVMLWKQGDVDTIHAQFAREARASRNLMQILLIDRNRRWTDWIANAMKRPGRLFIAVGAGHFGGPQGLLALLNAKGLKAQRAD